MRRRSDLGDADDLTGDLHVFSGPLRPSVVHPVLAPVDDRRRHLPIGRAAIGGEEAISQMGHAKSQSNGHFTGYY